MLHKKTKIHARAMSARRRGGNLSGLWKKGSEFGSAFLTCIISTGQQGGVLWLQKISFYGSVRENDSRLVNVSLWSPLKGHKQTINGP